MAIRTPLLTVLSKGPPIILRGFVFAMFKVISKLTNFVNGQRWAIASWTFSAGHPFCHVKSHVCRFDGRLFGTCSLERPTFNEPSSWLAARLPGKCTPPTLQQIRQNRNDRYWSSSSKVTEQIGWRVVMFWHPGEYASALSQNSDVFQKRSLLANIIIWSCMYICHLFISSCCEGPLTPYEFLPGLSRANVLIAFPLYQCSSLETSGRPGRVDGSFVSVRWDLLFATIFGGTFWHEIW